jgi:hypothetical protein
MAPNRIDIGQRVAIMLNRIAGEQMLKKQIGTIKSQINI